MSPLSIKKRSEDRNRAGDQPSQATPSPRLCLTRLISSPFGEGEGGLVPPRKESSGVEEELRDLVWILCSPAVFRDIRLYQNQIKISIKREIYL